jgi:hypothetical protein
MNTRVSGRAFDRQDAVVLALGWATVLLVTWL